MAVELAQEIDVSQIRIDGDTQPRAALNHDTINDYAQSMRDGDIFPPIVVHYDGSSYWLADGFHRFFAAKRTGREEIEAEIRQGTRRDAVLFSVGTNASHGLRRTNADKHRAVETLLKDEEWVEWSDREISRRCNVDHKTVGSIRAELSLGNFPSEENDPFASQVRNYTTKYGTTASMNTSHLAYAQQSRDALPPLPLQERARQEQEELNLRFDPEVLYAYCKYCYRTHNDWSLQDNDAWMCDICDHATHDVYMDIRGIEGEEQEIKKERRDAHVMRVMGSSDSPENGYKQNWQAILYYIGLNAPRLDCPIMNEQFSVQEINAPDGRLGDRYHRSIRI